MSGSDNGYEGKNIVRSLAMHWGDRLSVIDQGRIRRLGPES